MQLGPLQIIFIFIAFLLTILFVYLIKKIYYRIRYKKRFFVIPRVSVKGITYIAMVIAISVVVIILLTVLSANILSVVFRAWPGTRVTIEGILIKIGGLLFGPIIGIFIGAMTDLLTVALSAGVFHYGYLIACMAYGLIGGIVKVLFLTSRNKKYIYAILVTIISCIIAICIVLYLHYNTDPIWAFSMFGMSISIPKEIMIGLLASFIISASICVWISFLIQSIRSKKNPSINEKMNIFSLTIVAIIWCEAIVNVIMMPSFDAELSSLTYMQWLTIRTLLFFIMIFVNLIVIYPVFKIVIPLTNYDYSKDLVEPLSVKIYVD